MSGWFGLTSKIGLLSGTGWPICLSICIICGDSSPSAVTSRAGLSTRRLDTRTSLARLPNTPLSFSTTGLKVSSAFLASSFSASSVKSPKSTAPLAMFCSGVPSYSNIKFIAHSSTGLVIKMTSMPFFLNTSSCGLALAAARFSAVR